MRLSIVALALASILTAVGFLDAVAYLDDGTTICGFLYTRLSALDGDS